jgi:cobyrinic acid a,c-diamide synthase
MVAGTHSGAGKTTVSLILMAALRDSGYRVQPFKLGPDFIDPSYHRLATERDSINLDPWLVGLPRVRRTFARFAVRSDIAVVESMGGLFDGASGSWARSSPAFFARRLGIPVVLVLDVWGMTRSAHAVLNGFLGFDPRLRIAGFILNRAGSARHAAMVLTALSPHLRAQCLGYVLHSSRLTIPERHLGLLTVDEHTPGPTWQHELQSAGQTIDLRKLVRILRLTRRAPDAPGESARRPTPRVRLAIARDQAFCFYYPENLEMLEQAGAELCPFSPIRDARLPPGVEGIYLGGGYPESFAAELAANTSMKTEIAAAAVEGMPIYAECGGLMYLGRTLRTFDRVEHPMASVFPLDFVMDKHHLVIRYVNIRTTGPTLLGPRGTVVRGHEFHQSRLIGNEGRAYQVRTSGGEAFREGFVLGNTLGSYIHLHFGSNPAIPARVIASCLARRLSGTAGAATAAPPARESPGT